MSSERQEKERSDGGTYVHRPDGASSSEPKAAVESRGWALVGVVVLSVLVIPGVIYLRPATPTAFGLPFIASMLVLPMVPALLLGLTAIWSMKGPADE